MDKVEMAPLSMCFQHCATQFSYWAWIFGPLILFTTLALFIHRWGIKTNKDVDNIIKVVCVVAIFALVAAIFINPVNLHANTSLEWAKAGKWIGY